MLPLAKTSHRKGELLSYYATRLVNILKEEGLQGLTQRIAARSKRFIHGKYSLTDAYDDEFFIHNLADSRPQAEWLAPKLTCSLGIRSVVDLGCATGTWVDAFLRCGVDAAGVEGSHSARRYLVCPTDRVVFADLREPLRIPARPVDLALSIEVAEHIEAKYADTFVANILRYKPRLIFMTAAPPGQGGHFHVNEQPYDYWIERFRKFDYAPDAGLRELVAGFVDEGRRLQDVPAVMQWPEMHHQGVWIPQWMPANLLIFSKVSLNS
jgi:SAM-dependent methyltransferase